MKWSIALCGLLAAVPAAAEETNVEITVLSTRLKAAVPWSEHRDARTGETVSDLLGAVPGVTLLDGGVAGSRTELFVRGADANFTAVLIEGVPVNDLSDARGGAYDFTTLSGDELKGVTVGQGPLSALYGSGTLAGVVNLEFDLPVDPHFYLAASGDDEYTVRLGGGHIVAPGTSLAAAGRFGEDGDRDLGQWRRLSTLTAKMTTRTDNQSLSLFARAADSDSEGFDIASGGILYSATGERQTLLDQDRMAGLSLRRTLGGGRTLVVQASGFRRDQDRYTPANPEGVFSGTPATIQTSRFDRVQATAALRGEGERVDYTLGVELMREDGEVEGVLDFGGGFALPTSFAQQRDSAGAFGEGQVRLGHGLTLRAGARADSRKNETGTWSHRATVEWMAPNADLMLAATWGQAIKVPSFYALGDPLVGSPDLRNERSEGGELRAVWRRGDLRLTAAAHSTVYRDLIDFDFMTFKLVNRNEVEISGLDLGLEGRVTPTLAYEARLSTLRHEVNGVEGGLLHRPEQTAALDLTWAATPKVTVRLDNRYVGKRQSSSIPTGSQTLDVYTRSDLTVSYRLENDVSAALRLGNLWDQSYETVSGFQARGRHIMLSLSGPF